MGMELKLTNVWFTDTQTGERIDMTSILSDRCETTIVEEDGHGIKKNRHTAEALNRILFDLDDLLCWLRTNHPDQGW